MRRWFILLASIAISFCLGGVYSWSAYVPALREEHGLTATQCQVIFGIAIAVFTLVMVPSGRALSTIGPLRLVMAGGLLLGAGYLFAAWGGGSFYSLLAGIGVLGGAGIGLAYVCPMTVCIRWFPAHRGLITGLTVCGFGAGGMGAAAFISGMQSHGASALQIMEWMGFAYAIVIACGALLLRMPKSTDTTSAVQRRGAGISELFRSQDFRVLCLGMFAGTFSGLMIIGNLRSIGEAAGMSSSVALLGVSLFAIGNAAGRVSWGWLVDRFGRVCIPGSLALLAVSITFLVFPAGHKVLFLSTVASAGFGFGACFVVYPAQVAERFGSERLGAVYPIVFLFYGLSGIVGPVSGGAMFDATGSFRTAMLCAWGVVLGGGVATVILDRSPSAEALQTRNRKAIAE